MALANATALSKFTNLQTMKIRWISKKKVVKRGHVATVVPQFMVPKLTHLYLKRCFVNLESFASLLRRHVGLELLRVTVGTRHHHDYWIVPPGPMVDAFTTHPTMQCIMVFNADQSTIQLIAESCDIEECKNRLACTYIKRRSRDVSMKPSIPGATNAENADGLKNSGID
jgi:hypothetical protein